MKTQLCALLTGILISGGVAAALDNGPQDIHCSKSKGRTFIWHGDCRVQGSGMNQGISWTVVNLDNKVLRIEEHTGGNPSLTKYLTVNDLPAEHVKNGAKTGVVSDCYKVKGEWTSFCLYYTQK